MTNASIVDKMKLLIYSIFALFILAIGIVIAVATSSQRSGVTSIAASIAGMPTLERAASFIDGDKFEQLAQSLDPEDPFYIEVSEKFRTLKSTIECKYLYSMARYEDGTHRFIFDGEDPGSPIFSPLGDVEDVSIYHPNYLKTFETRAPQSTSATYQSEWGILISAYKPILNSKGDAVGIIGIDFHGEEIDKVTWKNFRMQSALALLCLLVGFFLFRWLLGGINRQNEKLLEMVAQSEEDYRAISELTVNFEVASKAKGDFLAKMSHEIRTPLNAIAGMSNLALREEMSNAAREHVHTIRQSGSNLLVIINDLLDISKIESGKLEIFNGAYYFSSLINDVVSIIRVRALEAGLKFIVDIDPGIPSELIGDEVRLRQVLLNIAGNAVKYTPKGHLSIAASVEVLGEGMAELKIEVADSGKGIKPENIEKLFGEFVQVDSAANKGIEGTGLGLAISKSLAVAMGGDITVKSEYGKGSTFAVAIPQGVAGVDKTAFVENPGDKSVLLYEMREMIADSIQRSVASLGVGCAVAADAHEFEEKLATGGYPFAFIASGLHESVRLACEKHAESARIVLLRDFGEPAADSVLTSISMPAYAIPIANILNGGQGGFDPLEGHGNALLFEAPEAVALVVDDVGTNRNVAKGLLQLYGIQSQLCSSGMEAIEAIGSKGFDFVLMDHMMPEMDGIEAAMRIRAMGIDDQYFASVPIIALTANALSGAKEMYLANGFSDFLPKPVEMAQLGATLAKWIPADKKCRPSAPRPQSYNGMEAIKIEGIDVSLGLAASGVSLEIYRDTLPIFMEDGREKLEKFKAALEAADMPLIANYAHALKSSAAYVGAVELSELARALESAGKHKDLGLIQKHAPLLLDRLAEVTDNIAAAMKSGAIG
jgi:signal transduction histidine kinase/CheY-like chemotaxis protein/HPt (histidine-containing phosphotransfer) domain-containing protein